MSRFQGIYTPLLEQFIDFKRNLGYKFIDAESVYYQFDRFTIQNREVKIGITKELSERWAMKRLNEADTTCYKRIMYLIQFSLFINDLGYQSYIPRLTQPYKSTFIPYIFSHSEIDAIFAASDKLKMNNFMDSTVNVVPVLLRILYGTGIRIGEACSLKVSDVNLNEKYFVIRNSKNGKERLIPLSDSIVEACIQYRKFLCVIEKPDGYFFVKRNGYACRPKTVYGWFRKVLLEAKISHGGKGYGPRLHDLRHTFSVHSLATMAASGLDLYYSLPILSEYLGHQSLEATDKYVRLTSEMYPSLLKDVNSICSYIFPEVYDHEAN